MPEEANIIKAILQEIRWDTNNKVLDVDMSEKTYPQRKVQFNPETLKVTFSNQLASGDDSGAAAIQFASKGTTKISIDLIYDVTAPTSPVKQVEADPKAAKPRDVRELTSEVVFFMQTREEGAGDDTKHIPPGIRFQWGSFLFEGVMESINETLELFSADGRPLRSIVSISLVKQDVDIQFAKTGTAASSQNPSSATRPQQAARQDEPLQQMAGRLGKGAKWQDIAQANNIENPRMIPIGTLIDV